MTEYRVWVEAPEKGAEQAHTFADEQAVKQFIVDQVQAGRTVRTEFAYMVHGDGFTDPANIEIVTGDWRDRLNQEIRAARERKAAQEGQPDV